MAEEKKSKQKAAGDPHENAVQFLLHHVMKHGDGPSSIAAQDHLAAIHEENPPSHDVDEWIAKMEADRVKMADDAAIEAAAKQKKEDAEAKKADDEAAAKAEQHRKHLASVEDKAKASDAASKPKK